MMGNGMGGITTFTSHLIALYGQIWGFERHSTPYQTVQKNHSQCDKNVTIRVLPSGISRDECPRADGSAAENFQKRTSFRKGG